MTPDAAFCPSAVTPDLFTIHPSKLQSHQYYPTPHLSFCCQQSRLCSLVLLPLVLQLSCAANPAENIFCYQLIYSWEPHLLCAQYLLFFPPRGKQKMVRMCVLDHKSVRNAAGLLWLIAQGSTTRTGHAWWS